MFARHFIDFCDICDHCCCVNCHDGVYLEDEQVWRCIECYTMLEVFEPIVEEEDEDDE